MSSRRAIHQERDLLDHGQRIGDPALPEFRPERVDAPFQFSRDHDCSVLSFGFVCERVLVWRAKTSDDLKEIVDLLFALEDAVEAVGIDDSEGLLIEPIDA